MRISDGSCLVVKHFPALVSSSNLQDYFIDILGAYLAENNTGRAGGAFPALVRSVGASSC